MRTPFEDYRPTLVMAAAALACVCHQSILAATLSVPGDYATIQAAIDASVAGDTGVTSNSAERTSFWMNRAVATPNRFPHRHPTASCPRRLCGYVHDTSRPVT